MPERKHHHLLTGVEDMEQDHSRVQNALTENDVQSLSFLPSGLCVD